MQNTAFQISAHSSKSYCVTKWERRWERFPDWLRHVHVTQIHGLEMNAMYPWLLEIWNGNAFIWELGSAHTHTHTNTHTPRFPLLSLLLLLTHSNKDRKFNFFRCAFPIFHLNHFVKKYSIRFGWMYKRLSRCCQTWNQTVFIAA